MVKLTMIARVSDGLPLAEGLEHFREHNDLDFYKQKSKLLFRKISQGQNGASRMSLGIEPYCFHYIIEDDVCNITLCDQSYPRKLALHYLEDLQREFGKLHRSQIETASKPYAFIKFDSIIQRIRKLYLDTRTQRNLSKLNNSDQIQVQQIMTKDLSDVVANGENNYGKDSEVGQSGGVVICAGTSVRHPVSPQKLFDFLRDEQIRSQCGVLSSGKWEKLASISNGSDPSNCISLFNVSYQGNAEEMLQESCRRSYGCVVVCSPINLEALNSQDPSSIPIPPPSGFAILPDHASSTNNSLIRTRILHEAASSSSSGWGSLYSGYSGSLLTIAFQATQTNLSTNIFSNEYVAKIHDIINGNVQSIKAALGCVNV